MIALFSLAVFQQNPVSQSAHLGERVFFTCAVKKNWSGDLLRFTVNKEPHQCLEDDNELSEPIGCILSRASDFVVANLSIFLIASMWPDVQQVSVYCAVPVRINGTVCNVNSMEALLSIKRAEAEGEICTGVCIPSNAFIIQLLSLTKRWA